MLDADTKRDIEDLKRQLGLIQDEENKILKDLEVLRAKKNEINEKLKELSNDEKYQQDMLAMVYQQRHGGSSSKKE